MEDREIYCIFQNKKKLLTLIKDYNAFIGNFIKEFNLEERIDDLDFFIFKNNKKRKFDKKIFKNFLQDNINEVYCEYINKFDESTPIDSNQLLLKQIANLEKLVDSLCQQNKMLKEKCEESEQKLTHLETEFESYKKETQNDISKLQYKILNIDDINITDSIRNNFLNSNISKYEDIEDTPKLIKRGKITPKNNDDDILENEKPINRNRTPMDNNENNMNYEYNEKRNSFQKSNIKNYETEYSDSYNKEYENKNNFITNNSNMNNNYLNNNKSINNSNDNYYNTKINNNSKNNFKNNNLEIKKKSKIETPNDEKSIKKNKNQYLSCEFIINSRIPSKLKSSIKKTLSVTLSFELKNNGQNSIPEQAIIQYDKEDSDLIISDYYINNGKELKPNQKIPIKIQAYFKDQNNIKSKIYKLKFYLFHKKYGKIGNDGLFQIQILDESDNIIENSKNIYKNYNENNEFEKNEQESYLYRDSNNYYQNQYE